MTKHDRPSHRPHDQPTARASAERDRRASWRTPASAGSSPTTWSRSLDRGHGLARRPARAVRRRSRWTRPPTSCTTARRSSRASRRTGRPTARSRRSVRTPTPAASSARPRRLAMPELPEELFLASIEALVDQDATWVPDDREKSLYLRPFMFATEVGLGVRPADAVPVTCSSPRRPASYFPAACKPGHGLAVRRSTSARRPAAPARPSAAATTPRRCAPRRRPPSRAATRWLAGRARAPLGRGDGRHEPVLRRTAPARTPASSPPS